MGVRPKTLARGKEWNEKRKQGTDSAVGKKPIEKRKQVTDLAVGKKPSGAEETGGRGLFASCSFTDLGLHPTLCQHLQDAMGFRTPTAIQAKSIPVVISGRHLLVNAATGTGKTLIYLAPIVHLLQMRSPQIERSDGTFALVLVPTRELCMQVYEILQKMLHRFHWIVPGYIMGGENRSKEKARLRKGISILIATPGRLLDHLKNTSSFSYKNLQWIVFDEADRILELGFGKAIEEILDFLNSRQDKLPEEKNKGRKPRRLPRQNLLLSATLNEKVNQLAKISLENPVMVGLDSRLSCNLIGSSACEAGSKMALNDDESDVLKISHGQSTQDYNLPEQLVQRYVKVPCGTRLVVLLSILKNFFERETFQKIVVFFSTCDAVDFHHSLFGQFNWSPSTSYDQGKKEAFVKCKTLRLHGNMEHDDRKASFQTFNAEKSALLLCTDVAARGLDFPKVRCIIQYDSPGEATEYVHRVGRTARLGEKGEAILFLQPVETDYLHDLQKHGVVLKEFPLLKIFDSFAMFVQKHSHKRMVSVEMHPWVLALQRALEAFIGAEPDIKMLAKDAFCTWIRAYTAHRGELKRIFMVKKLHLGHVARSFGLKDQPSLVGGSFKMQSKKRKRDHRHGGSAKAKPGSKKPKSA